MWGRSVEKVLVLRRFSKVSKHKMIIILITCVILGACGRAVYRAPVSDVDQPPSRKLATHLVAPGETLYSIAWRYDLDFNALAEANGITSDFKIYPGQKLDLNVEARKPWAERQKQRRTPTVTKPQVKEKPVRSINETKPIKIDTNEIKTRQLVQWHWPLRGKILTRFKANKGLQKGIDIHGKLGDAVMAASSGVVVYSGAGLRGYGKLLIVKHSDEYLSAYAHNRRLLVKEGDSVKAGEKIAEVGSTGTDTVKLYFEIRRDGKPVNPLLYLPKM